MKKPDRFPKLSVNSIGKRYALRNLKTELGIIPDLTPFEEQQLNSTSAACHFSHENMVYTLHADGTWESVVIPETNAIKLE